MNKSDTSVRGDQEAIEKVSSSFHQFRNEVGTQLVILRGVQGVIVGGVENLAQSIEAKLTENEERDEKQEQVLGTLYKRMRK